MVLGIVSTLRMIRREMLLLSSQLLSTVYWCFCLEYHETWSWSWSWQAQCNVFDDVEGEVALTAGGGRRELPLLKNTFEDVALVSLEQKCVVYTPSL